MNFLEHFDHTDKKQDKEHFKHLIQVALADGIIKDIELKMLQRLGKNMGFTDPEMDDLMESTKKSSYHPPYELTRRFDQIYSIVKMVLADGETDISEMQMTKTLALKSGFAETEIPALLSLLIDGIKNEKDEEDLFNVYKKKIMTF